MFYKFDLLEKCLEWKNSILFLFRRLFLTEPWIIRHPIELYLIHNYIAFQVWFTRNRMQQFFVCFHEESSSCLTEPWITGHPIELYLIYIISYLSYLYLIYNYIAFQVWFPRNRVEKYFVRFHEESCPPLQFHPRITGHPVYSRPCNPKAGSGNSAMEYYRIRKRAFKNVVARGSKHG